MLETLFVLIVCVLLFYLMHRGTSELINDVQHIADVVKDKYNKMRGK